MSQFLAVTAVFEMEREREMASAVMAASKENPYRLVTPVEADGPEEAMLAAVTHQSEHLMAALDEAKYRAN